MNSVSTPARFLVCSKTKRAGCSLSRPCRAVPRITGIKRGFSEAISVVSISELPMAGFEPARACYGPTDFKSVASAISPHRRLDGPKCNHEGPVAPKRNGAGEQRAEVRNSPIKLRRQKIMLPRARRLSYSFSREIAREICRGGKTISGSGGRGQLH